MKVDMKDLNDRISRFLNVLMAPSTIKGIIILLGLAGVSTQPEYLQEIIMALGVVYAAIAILFQKS